MSITTDSNLYPFGHKNPTVYTISQYGHRLMYANTLCHVLNAKSFVAIPNHRSLVRLLRIKDPVVFATLDDSPAFYLLVSILRSLLARKTLGISLESFASLETRSPKKIFKRFFFNLIEHTTLSQRLSVIPLSLSPKQNHRKSLSWIYDPAFWDLCTTEPFNPRSSTLDLSDLLGVSLDSNSPIVLYLGSIDPRKGFDKFVEFSIISRQNNQNFIFIAAGHYGPKLDPSSIDLFLSSGGVLLNRRLTEDEVLVLQCTAHVFWGCYHPSFDQSSGIAGRAFQLNKIIIVRRKSLSEKLLSTLSAPLLSVTYEEISSLPELVAAACLKHRNSPFRLRGHSLRDFSINRLYASLDC